MPLPTERLDTFSGDAISDFLSNAALGQIPNAEIVYIFGHSPVVAGGSTSVLWPPNGSISTTGIFPSAPVTCYVSSSNAADIGQTIRLKVVDSNWNHQFVGVTLNGQNAIVLPIQVRRVLLIENMGTTNTAGNVYAGTEIAPVGGIPARLNTMNMFMAEDQISHLAIYTIPSGYVLLVHEVGGGTPSNDSGVVNVSYSSPDSKVYKLGIHIPIYRGSFSQRVTLVPRTEKIDLYMSIAAFTNNIEATGYLFGILVPAKYFKT